MATEKKDWYKSKTKWGALLVGLGIVLGTVGSMVNGTLNYGAGITALLTEIGAILAVFGIRDLPFINKK